MSSFIKTILFYLPFVFVYSSSNSNEYLSKFEHWADTFNIHFQNENHLYDILKKWIVNEKYIQYINSQQLPYQLGHNQFSGMDEFDFIQYILQNRNFYNYPRKIDLVRQFTNDTLVNIPLPSSVDWVSAGAVTPVKDQGQCGSCWSFSTTGALEGVFFIQNKQLVSFSEQQLVDCDTLKNGGKDHGCNGGLMDNAFDWIHKNGGLCDETSYPYISQTGKTQSCQTTCKLVYNSKISSHIDVEQTDDAFMDALAQQPVSIAIEADQRDFQLYKSGVFTGKCGTNLDHGVLAVGYGMENKQDYYLVKNSWGESWGENGYIKLARGPQYNNGQGQCGILMEASYPVL